MKKIVAIGGGEIGRPGYPVETLIIDKEIIKLSGKKHPKLLFIPTASSDSEGYVTVVKKYFGKKLGCKTNILYLINKKITKKEIYKRILSSDIIYVGGGNTAKMLKIWKKHGVDKMLKKAYKKGVVLSGVSAGAICWFKYGSSDSKRFSGKKKWSLMRVFGLNLIPALLSPHHLREKMRKKGVKELMRKTSGIGIALDDYCAIEIVDDKYRLITSKKGSGAHKVYPKNGKMHYKKIRITKEFKSLKNLLIRG